MKDRNKRKGCNLLYVVTVYKKSICKHCGIDLLYKTVYRYIKLYRKRIDRIDLRVFLNFAHFYIYFYNGFMSNFNDEK